MNEQGIFGGSVCVVGPRITNKVKLLGEQDFLYTLLTQGIKDGKEVKTSKIISSVQKGINPYTQYQEFLDLASIESVEFIVSNTTEAGIVFDKSDTAPEAGPSSVPKTYPAKLTALLYKRFTLGLAGYVILPLELIEKNAEKLKNCVVGYANLWNLPADFLKWLNDENTFLNTLVDRIVPGFPCEGVQEIFEGLGYRDDFLVKTEPYEIFVIETQDKAIIDKLPLQKAGINVVWTNDITRYREQKVFLLNAPHTAMAMIGLLADIKSVGEFISDKTLFEYINALTKGDIISALDYPKSELVQYSDEIIERFKNPYNEHLLASISLNSVSKFSARILPIVLRLAKKGTELGAKSDAELGAGLGTELGTELGAGKVERKEEGALGTNFTMCAFALAALLKLYKDNPPQDSAEVLQAFAEESKGANYVHNILSRVELWVLDLTNIDDFESAVNSIFCKINDTPIYEVLMEYLPKNTLKINPIDNVVVAVRSIKKGEVIDAATASMEASAGGSAVSEVVQITSKSDILPGHKIAISDIQAGQDVVKYGYPIGHATTDIGVGDWVHVHNVKTNLKGIKEYEYSPELSSSAVASSAKPTFKGYLRKNGEVGVRNTLFIVPTVGCINGLCEQIKRGAKDQDNVIILKHPYGCSQLGGDLDNTTNILADAIVHPNAGGVLVVGLGCENLRLQSLISRLEEIGGYDKERVKFLMAQAAGDEVQEGIDYIGELEQLIASDKRGEFPLSKLKIGLKCGGSDGFSGITANPLIGLFSDYLIENGGSTVLTEVPEMFGAEEILMNRAVNEEVFEKVVALINDFKKYFESYNEPIYENPSPGNKDGGITTLEDKSLGCTQKAGSMPVVDVLKYGSRIQKQGLSLLNSPGNDLVAASALASSGCQIVLFSTGRGTPYGTYVPTIKVASNTSLADRKPRWIDFNAGKLVQGETFAHLLEGFIDLILDTANGKPTKNELNFSSELAIFKNGVTL
jgi:altronate dehydratase/mannitol-1-phosphate/altronate dehydrogenase